MCHTLFARSCIIGRQTAGGESEKEQRCFNLHGVFETVSKSELRIARAEDIARTQV